VKASRARKHKNRKLSTAKRRSNKQILPALIAVGGACGLAAAPVSALELGNIRIDSSLGQPLRASIAYALNPNEQMFDFCIFLKPGLTANGIPVLSNARITITDGAIVLNGRVPIREPLLAMQLSVNCPYTAHLARNYTLMLDPALPTADEPVARDTDAAALTPAQTPTVTASGLAGAQKPTPTVPTRVRPQDNTPIAASSRYLVQAGDSLSQIVARIENRSVALWPAVEVIFAVNPDAFLNDDRNLLKAGSWLVIPDMSGETVVAAASDASPVPQTAVAPDAQSSASYTGVTATETATAPAEVAEPASVPEAAAATVEAAAEPAIATNEAPARPEMRPGDIIIGSDSPFVIPVGSDEIVDIPEVAIESQPIAKPAPPIVSRNTGDDGTSGAWSWLLWLGGTGLALILGLLMFGRQLRQRFGSVAVSAPAVPSRRVDDPPAAQSPGADVDFDFDDDTLNSQAMTLDVDLGAGTGLQDGSEMDVAQDYGFSASGDNDYQVDLEITEHASRDEEAQPTDIIPPERHPDSTVLESEIMPSDDDAVPEGDTTEDYDMSMIVDATKHALEDITATTKDLQAVLVAADSESESDSSGQTTRQQTSIKNADYQILEQDYEDEMTATQALNKEIEEAAQALAERMDEVDINGDTTEMPVSPDVDTTAELTANLQPSGKAQNEDFADSGNIPELLVENPLGEIDSTSEMESGSIDTKKSKAS
jgi:hypothetical protein